jgi:hypothetical protein
VLGKVLIQAVLIFGAGAFYKPILAWREIIEVGSKACANKHWALSFVWMF